MKSDAQLLRDYAERANEAAFREIVTRHTDFVYSAALRQVESSAVASDLAQSVFTDLARKANSLAEKITDASSLAGFETALKENNINYTMHKYPGTQHGFNNDTTPRYDEAAARLAWQRTVDFFNKHLRG